MCPVRLIPGINDKIIPIPVSTDIDFSNLGFFLNLQLINKKFFFPKMVVIRINASIPYKTPLKPIAKDIGFL